MSNPNGDFDYRPADQTFKCGRCGKSSVALPPNSTLARDLTLVGALGFLRLQGWVTISRLDHTLTALCPSCQPEFIYDKWQLHELEATP